MLQIQTLSFKRNASFLFCNLNFQLNAGELLQVTGANGSGKTTLLRIIASFLKPSEGHIYYSNRSIYQSNSCYQTEVAYLGHSNAIKPSLTVKENLISHACLMGSKEFELDELLKQLSLITLAKTLAYQLSQGQQRRLALAKIVLSQKLVWILDEPLTALDQSGVEQFNWLLKQHLDANGIAIIATHQPLNPLFHSIKQLAL